MFTESLAGQRLREAFREDCLAELITSQRHHRISALLEGLTKDLLAASTLEAAIVRRLVPTDSLRIYMGRTPIDVDRMKIVADGQTDAAGVAQLARQGATLSVNRADRVFPSLSDLAVAATDWLGEAIELVAVLSYGERSGFSLHADLIDLFIIQLEGTKLWELHGEPPPPGQARDKSAPETLRASVTLHPGDVMFLPRGQRHICTAQGKSLHLALLLQPVSAKQAVAKFAAELERDPILNMPLLGCLGAEYEAALLGRYKARLHELVDAFDLVGVMREQRDRTRLNPEIQFSAEPPSKSPRRS